MLSSRCTSTLASISYISILEATSQETEKFKNSSVLLSTSFFCWATSLSDPCGIYVTWESDVRRLVVSTTVDLLGCFCKNDSDRFDTFLNSGFSCIFFFSWTSLGLQLWGSSHNHFLLPCLDICMLILSVNSNEKAWKTTLWKKNMCFLFSSGTDNNWLFIYSPAGLQEFSNKTYTRWQYYNEELNCLLIT